MRRFTEFEVPAIAVLGFLAVVAGLSLVNGAPTKTTVWKATLSGNGLIVAQGDNPFQGGTGGVAITDGTGRCGCGSTTTNYSYVQFIVQSPTQLLFALDNPVLHDNAEGNACGFPEVGCLTNFLDVPQPCQGYESVCLFFSFGGCDDPKANDFRTIDVGSVLKGNLQVQIRPFNLGVGCPDAALLVHWVFGRIHGQVDITTPEGYDIYIKRTAANAWTIRVATEMDNAAYPINVGGSSNCFLTDGLFEEYISCTGPIIGKGGRTSYQTEYFFPSFIRGGLNFEIALTK